MKSIVTIDPSDLRCPFSALRNVSMPIQKIDSNVISIIEELRSRLRSIPYAAGLSAVQIGIPLQVAIVNLIGAGDTEILLINPHIIRISGRVTERSEGCISLPHYKGQVSRRNKIVIETTTLEGSRILLASNGYQSAVIQHELDHMSGLFYWDRMKDGKVPMPLITQLESKYEKSEL